jgi:hypothetical protein
MLVIGKLGYIVGGSEDFTDFWWRSFTDQSSKSLSKRTPEVYFERFWRSISTGQERFPHARTTQRKNSKFSARKSALFNRRFKCSITNSYSLIVNKNKIY